MITLPLPPPLSGRGGVGVIHFGGFEVQDESFKKK